MTLTTTQKIWAVVLAMFCTAVVLYGFQARANVTDHGVVSIVASSSLMSVGPGNSTTLFTKAANCAARIVTTYANPIMLSFTSSLTPSATVGHLQAASTTVAYDNLVYGCGQLSAYGYTASTSITVTQTIQ